MKVAEPTSVGAAVGAGIAAKAGAALGAGALGALIIAIFDPPKTRRELLLQATAAGVGSLVFGPLIVRVLSRFVDWYSLVNVTGLDYFEMVIPIYFLTGALSWGIFAAIAKGRTIIGERGAQAVADRVLGPEDKPQ